MGSGIFTNPELFEGIRTGKIIILRIPSYSLDEEVVGTPGYTALCMFVSMKILGNPIVYHMLSVQNDYVSVRLKDIRRESVGDRLFWTLEIEYMEDDEYQRPPDLPSDDTLLAIDEKARQRWT